MGTHLIYPTSSYGTSHLATNSSLFPLHSCTTQYRIDRCEAANHGSIPSTSNSVCIHCFLQYTPNYWISFLFLCCLYSTGITPTPLLSNHHTMALTKTLKPSKTTSSIIKTRAQARTEARTGTNVRTNDDTIAPAPAPVAVATGHNLGLQKVKHQIYWILLLLKHTKIRT